MKYQNKLVSILLLAAILISNLSACGSSSGDKTSENTETQVKTENQTAETETTADIHDTLNDSVPELDFDGASFRVILQDTTVYDLYVAEESGDVLEDSIYYRNRAVEERFNVKIAEPLLLSCSNISPRVKKMVNAGDDEYDLVIGQMETEGVDAVAGYF